MSLIIILQYIGWFLLCLIMAIIAYFQYAYNYWRMKGVQYVPAWFLQGSIGQWNDTLHSAQYFQNMYNEFKQKSAKCVGFYIYLKAAMLIIDLDLIEKILVTDAECFSDRGLYSNKKDEPLSVNLITMDDPEWSVMRHKLLLIFTPKNLEKMFDTVDAMGIRLVRQIDHHMRVKSTTIEVRDILARYTTDVIARCAFGYDCNSLEDPKTAFRLIGQSVFTDPPNSRPVALLKADFKWLANKLHVKNYQDFVSSYFMDVVKLTVSTREELLKNGEQDAQEGKDLIDLLIELKNSEDPNKRITIEEVAAQAFLFYLAGFETSSTTLAYCLYELAGSKQEQNKLRKEIRQAYRKNGDQFSYGMMKNDLKQMDKVIKETLRKYPPAAVLMRKVNKDYQIEHEEGKYFTLKKGTQVFIPNYAIHYDEEFYDNPQEFKPTRFNKDLQRKMTWLPFGEGRRRCMGRDFGMMEVKVALTHIIHSFEVLNRKEPLEYHPNMFILTPVDGITLTFKKAD